MKIVNDDKINPFFSKKRIGVFYNPFYLIRRGLYLGIENYASQFSGKLIDLGCGTKPYLHLFKNVNEYIGVDVEHSGNTDNKNFIDIFYDGKNIPFKNDSIDGIFSSETFEHVFNLDDVLKETHRVLKPNALLLFTCPFFMPEHEVPFDFARYTSFALISLLQKHGFEIIEQEKTGNYFTTMMQMKALYLYYFINKIPFFHQTFFVLFISPIFIFGSLINKILPKFMKRKDLYLNNIILAKKIS